MMDERQTDRLLGELFKRNAPYVIAPAVCERVEESLPLRQRRSRRTRRARTVAVGFAYMLLVGAIGLGLYQVVGYFRNAPGFVITDLTSLPGNTSAGTGTSLNAALEGKGPVIGTASLRQVKSRGATDAGGTTGTQGTGGVRGRVEVYTVTMSHSALSGTLEITYDVTPRGAGGADIQGSWVLSNAEGGWRSSSWNGTVTGDGMEQFMFGIATGTGGFDGLELLLEWHSLKEPGTSASAAGLSGSVVLSGWIQAVK